LLWAGIERSARYGWSFDWWNLLSIPLTMMDAIGRGIAQVFAVQLVLTFLWRPSQPSHTIKNQIPLLFATAFLTSQVLPFLIAWLTGQLDASGFTEYPLMFVSQFLSTLATVPIGFIAFYAIRPLVDPRFCDTKEPAGEDTGGKLRRPRGWSIMGLMVVTAGFALMTTSSIETQRMLEEISKDPNTFVFMGNPAVLEVYRLISTIVSALIVILVSALTFEVSSKPESHQKSSNKIIRRGIGGLVFLHLVMSFALNMMLSEQFTFNFYQIYNVVTDVGYLIAVIGGNSWFFKQWREAGYNLHIAVAEFLPFRNLQAD
jgi:hypothetical protein